MPPLVAHAERDDVDNSSLDEETVEIELVDDNSDNDWLVEYTDPDDWILVTEENIDSVELPLMEPSLYKPREGEGEEFDVKVTEEEVELLKDNQGHIWYEKVFEFLLPDFKGEGYYTWIAAQVRNYMTHLIRTQNYTPTYYKPEEDKVLGDHIARFFWDFRLLECSVAFCLSGIRGRHGRPCSPLAWPWRACHAGHLKTPTAVFALPTIGTSRRMWIGKIFT